MPREAIVPRRARLDRGRMARARSDQDRLSRPWEAGPRPPAAPCLWALRRPDQGPAAWSDKPHYKREIDEGEVREIEDEVKRSLSRVREVEDEVKRISLNWCEHK